APPRRPRLRRHPPAPRRGSGEIPARPAALARPGGPDQRGQPGRHRDPLSPPETPGRDRGTTESRPHSVRQKRPAGPPFVDRPSRAGRPPFRRRPIRLNRVFLPPRQRRSGKMAGEPLAYHIGVLTKAAPVPIRVDRLGSRTIIGYVGKSGKLVSLSKVY